MTPPPRTVAVRRLRATSGPSPSPPGRSRARGLDPPRHPIAALVPWICWRRPPGSPLSALGCSLLASRHRARSPLRPLRPRDGRPSPNLGRVRLETRRVADLVPAAYNPWTISAEALAGLGESIGRYGLVQPIIVNARSGNVVGGHQRLKVLEAKGVEGDRRRRDRRRRGRGEGAQPGAQLPARSRASGRTTPSACSRRSWARCPTSATRCSSPTSGRPGEALPAEAGDISRTRSPSRPTTRSRSPATSGSWATTGCSAATRAREKDLDRLLAGAPDPPVNTDPPYNVKVEPRSNNAIAAGLSSFTSPRNAPPGARPRAPPREVQAHARRCARRTGRWRTTS